MTIRHRPGNKTVSMGWKDSNRPTRRQPGATKPPSINPNGTSQKFKHSDIDTLHEELLKASPNTAGVAEALHLVRWVNERVDTASLNDAQAACSQYASRCGLSEQGQKRAMFKINQILNKR